MPLDPEDRAAIRHVTRHNPPWLKGAYLGYHRPPVPKAAFAADGPARRAEPDDPAAARLAAAPGARLLDRPAAPAGGARPGGGDLRLALAELAGLHRADGPGGPAPGARRA